MQISGSACCSATRTRTSRSLLIRSRVRTATRTPDRPPGRLRPRSKMAVTPARVAERSESTELQGCRPPPRLSGGASENAPAANARGRASGSRTPRAPRWPRAFPSTSPCAWPRACRGCAGASRPGHCVTRLSTGATRAASASASSRSRATTSTSSARQPTPWLWLVASRGLEDSRHQAAQSPVAPPGHGLG